MVVRLLEERTFTPPHAVEVEHEGSWCPGFQRAWRLCDDDRGWVADAEYVAQHDWGSGKHLACVPPTGFVCPDIPVIWRLNAVSPWRRGSMLL